MNENDYAPGNSGVTQSTKLVVLSGCSGGGKSTLLAELSRRGHQVHPEPGRQIVKEQLFIKGDALPWKNPENFIGLCISRAIYFYNSTAASATPVWFDRSIVDAITALSSMGLRVPEHYSNALSAYRYHDKVFMVPPWRALFAEDAERKHSFSDAVKEFDALVESYPRQGYEVVLIPQLSVQERADFVEDHFR
jgi:predicted ATPase